LPILFALVLVSVVTLEIHGFRTAHLFAQEIWYPAGLERLLQFSGLYAAFVTAVLILAPWAFASLVTGLLLLLTAISVGPQALLAVIFFLVSAWCLGESLGEMLGKPGPLLSTPVLSTLIGISVYIFLMPFVARLPVNYPWVYAAALALPLLANWRGVRDRLPALLKLPASAELRGWADRAAFAVLVWVVAAHWFAVLKPEASADALSIHLAVPANIAAHHAMTFEPSRFVWAVMPMGADFSYSIVYLLGGECAARLLNFAILLMLAGLLYAAICRSVPPAAAYLLLALFLTTPMVQLVTGSLFVENLLAALLLGMMTAIWRFGETGETRFLYLASALGGTAMATKAGAAVYLAFALVCAIFEIRRHWNRTGASCALAALLLLATAAPPYVIAWAKTGNPLFPFLNERFHSGLLEPKADILDQRFRKPLTWNTPYDLTFHSSRHWEGQDGSFGFQYLGLAPLALLALLAAPRRKAITAAVVSLGGAILMLRVEPNARYLYPALPLLTIPLAALLGSMSHQRMLYRALLAFVIASTALNAYFLPASSYYHKDFFAPHPFSQSEKQRYMSDTTPIRAVIDWFNRAHPGAAVLLTSDSYIAGLSGEVYENHWHQFTTRNQLRRADGVPGVRRFLDQWRVRYFIARKPRAVAYTKASALQDLLDNCTALEYALGNFYVARLEPDCKAPAPPLAAERRVVQGGVYDDFDPAIVFHGDWTRTDEFKDSYRSTISFSDTPGAGISFEFEGAELIYVFTKAPNRGIAEISIDGVDQGKFDLYSPDIEWQSRLRFRVLGTGPHLLAIRVLGQSRPAAAGRFVDVDALEVR
jgi:hypothetical protein